MNDIDVCLALARKYPNAVLGLQHRVLAEAYIDSPYKTLKPLEWHDTPYGAWADSVVAKYSVERGSDVSGQSWFLRRIGPSVKRVDSVAEGKRECQEHYVEAVARLFDGHRNEDSRAGQPRIPLRALRQDGCARLVQGMDFPDN